MVGIDLCRNEKKLLIYSGVQRDIFKSLRSRDQMYINIYFTSESQLIDMRRQNNKSNKISDNTFPSVSIQSKGQGVNLFRNIRQVIIITGRSCTLWYNFKLCYLTSLFPCQFLEKFLSYNIEYKTIFLLKQSILISIL